MFLLDLFKKKQKIVTRMSRGYKIYMAEKLSNKLSKERYYVHLCMPRGKPSSVQLIRNENGTLRYIMTLKRFVGAKGFKNGDICDFSPENLIY